MTESRKSARMSWMARSSLALAALLAVSPLLETVSARAESEAAMELARKRKALRNGQPASSIRKPAAHSGYVPVAQGKATTTTEIVADKAVQPFLGSNAAADMAGLQSHYAQIVAAGGWPSVPKGSYKKGNQSDAIENLNKRLFIEGYLRAEAAQGEYASIYTSATEDAVMRFQKNMGLAATGSVDGATLAALNVSAQSRLNTIQANLPRVALYSQELGDRYVIVNVPAQQIQTVNGGRVYSQHNAIVGRPERPTPVVMAALSDINFNPYWNAPPSIIERDIIPKMSSGSTGILEKMNIKVFKGVGGPEIDPDTVNWNRAIPDDYHFRQEPGPENAMATAKINFPSPFGIYLHDTPEKQLFGAGGRFFSSGCVRVENMPVMLNWVLNGQDGYDPSRIANLAETLERVDVKLTAPPQLRVAYLTAWPAGGGLASFRPDIYQLDGSGFVTGQPLPVGEQSAEGTRFVLKPIPRQVAALEADEAEGFSWFSRTFGGRAKPKPAVASKEVKPKKEADVPAATAKATTKAKPSKATTLAAKPADDGKKPSAKAKPEKKPKGLFDWASYRADDKDAKDKKAKDKKTAKAGKTVKKPAAKEVAASKAKPAAKPKAKPEEVAAKAPVKPKDAKTPASETADAKAVKPDAKKKVTTVAATAVKDAETAKKPGEAAAKKPASAAVKPAKPAKPADETAKKPDTPAKPSALCADGKSGKDCKPVAQAKPKKKVVESAAN